MWERWGQIVGLLDFKHLSRLFFSSRPWGVWQRLHLHRRWSHRIWRRIRSRHTCGVHLWCSWGYNHPVNSLPCFSKKKVPWIPVCFLQRWPAQSDSSFLSHLQLYCLPPFSSMTLLFLRRFLTTQWKLLTIVGSWKALKTSKRTSNWWATLRVTSQNVRICTVMVW